MKKLFPLFLVALGSTSCIIMTQRAAEIIVHSQISTQIESCKRLGPITAEASARGQLDWPSVEQQAKNNLREKAAEKYGEQVDSVAVINMDRYTAKMVANGLAFKCFCGANMPNKANMARG